MASQSPHLWLKSDDGREVSANFDKFVLGGTSVSAPKPLNTAGEIGQLSWYSSTATSGTTYGQYIGLLGNGAGSEQIASRSKCLLATAGIGNAHGLHATLELDTTYGDVTGLGTGLRGNLVVADRAIAQGTYYGMMAEIYALGDTAALPAGSNACLCLNVQPGTAMDLVANAIAVNGTDGSGKMIYTHAPTTLAGSIRVLINGVAKYIPFYSTQ